MEQIRIPISHLGEKLNLIVRDVMSWEKVVLEYPKHEKVEEQKVEEEKKQ